MSRHLVHGVEAKLHLPTDAVVLSHSAGLVPTTQLNRYASSLQRCLSVCCLHHTLRCCHLTKTPRKAAEQVIDLAINEKYEGKRI